MSIRKRAFLLTAAAAAALSLGADAEARGRRGAGSRPERVHARSRLAPATASSLRVARLDVSRRNLQNQSIRLQVTDASLGQTLLVFVADASGAMQPVGSMRAEGRAGRAAWNVKTARGDTLPFGVSDVALLSGRAIEVRSDAGEVLLDGVLPTATRATGISRRMKSLKQGLAVDPSLSGVEARVVFRRGEHGRPDGFRIHVEGEAPGLALEAWLQGPDGSFVKLGDLVEEADDDEDQADDGDDDDVDDDQAGDDDDASDGRGRAKSETVDGDDEDDSDEDDADEDDDDEADDDEDGDEIFETTGGDAESEYEFQIDGSAALPFGAASLADLAGLTLEIRRGADQSVLASGTLPDTSAPGDESDDDDDDASDDDDDGDDDGGPGEDDDDDADEQDDEGDDD